MLSHLFWCVLKGYWIPSLLKILDTFFLCNEPRTLIFQWRGVTWMFSVACRYFVAGISTEHLSSFRVRFPCRLENCSHRLKSNSTAFVERRSRSWITFSAANKLVVHYKAVVNSSWNADNTFANRLVKRWTLTRRTSHPCRFKLQIIIVAEWRVLGTVAL